jgi:Fe2+ or Zn2+ uptake regulation protein
MWTKNDRAKCDKCGKFIDLNDESNIYRDFIPDTGFTSEEFIIKHKVCPKKKGKEVER